MSQSRFQEKHLSKQLDSSNMRLPEIEVDVPRLMRNYDSYTNVNLNRSVELDHKRQPIPHLRHRDNSNKVAKLFPRLNSEDSSILSPKQSESLNMIRNSSDKVHTTLNSVMSSNSMVRKVIHHEQRSNSSMEEAVKFSIANSS